MHDACICIMAAKGIIQKFLRQFNEKYSGGAREEMWDFYAPDGRFLSHNMKAAEGKQGIPRATNLPFKGP